MRVTSRDGEWLAYRETVADGDQLTYQWTIGAESTVSRIHNRREGWTIHMNHNMIDVTQLGMSTHFLSGQVECELELEVMDVYTVQRLMELTYLETGQPRDVSCASRPGSWYKVRVNITEREAKAIAQDGIPPLEVLLGPNGVTVRAVPLDMDQLVRELQLEDDLRRWP